MPLRSTTNTKQVVPAPPVRILDEVGDHTYAPSAASVHELIQRTERARIASAQDTRFLIDPRKS